MTSQLLNTHHLRHNVPDKCSGREELQRAKPGEAAPCAGQIIRRYHL